jgi:hypothetical protein
MKKKIVFKENKIDLEKKGDKKRENEQSRKLRQKATHSTESFELSKPGVFVKAPGGELLNIGVSYEAHDPDLKTFFELNSDSNCESELVYRLYNLLLPFLFFTNKLTIKRMEFPHETKAGKASFF